MIHIKFELGLPFLWGCGEDHVVGLFIKTIRAFFIKIKTLGVFCEKWFSKYSRPMTVRHFVNFEGVELSKCSIIGSAWHILTLKDNVYTHIKQI